MYSCKGRLFLWVWRQIYSYCLCVTGSIFLWQEIPSCSKKFSIVTQNSLLWQEISSCQYIFSWDCYFLLVFISPENSYIFGQNAVILAKILCDAPRFRRNQDPRFPVKIPPCMVEWTDLFVTLRNRGVHPIYLRLLISIYKNQQCNVKWAGKYSYRFSVSNGLRQGAVSSTILFSVYINGLFIILRNAGHGCHINGLFLGCFGYSDNLLLPSASRTGLQVMVNACQDFASSKNLKFSTHEYPDHPDKFKTKCLIFSRNSKDRENVSPVLLYHSCQSCLE